MPSTCRPTLIAVLLVIVPLSCDAAQSDFFPTDYVALENGQSSITGYAVRQTLGGPWKNDINLKYGEATANLFAVRATRHFSVGDQGQYTVGPVVVLSGVDASASGTLALTNQPVSGFGDLRLGGAFWFHVDRANREYALAALLVSLPTGDYRASQQLNVGENRVKTVLSLGWMRPLGERWVFDLAPEIAFFGDNPQYRYLGSNRRLSQDIAYAVTTNLRYKFTPGWHGYVSAQANGGGATQLDGSPYLGAPDNTRLALGTLLFTSENTQVQLRYAQDLQTSNGFRNTSEFALRWSVFIR
jgi:hypothetical protein